MILTTTQPMDRFTNHDLGSRAFHASSNHRPTPSTFKPIPPMQGFRTSAPKAAAHDSSTIDFFTFPEIPSEPPLNPFAQVRVPLLPDNYSPDRTASHAAEALDTPLLRPEIHIVAAHPERVAPAALSEVVGNDGLDVDLSALTQGFGSVELRRLKPPAYITEMFSGFGLKRPTAF